MPARVAEPPQPNDPYLETEEFKKDCKKAANKLLAEIEWRKRQLEKRIQEEEGVCAKLQGRAWPALSLLHGLEGSVGWEHTRSATLHFVCRIVSGDETSVVDM
jgi:hypothetical protein